MGEFSTVGSATVRARIAALQKKYGFSWDGSLFRDQDPDAFTARISLRRIPALAREAGVVKIELLSGYAS